MASTRASTSPRVPPVPTGFDDVQAQVRALLGARTGGFEERGEAAVIELDGRTLEVQVLPYGPDAAVVQVMTPLLVAVADRDELCEALATASLTFTRPLVFDDDAGRNVLLVQRVVGDQLRADVLDHAIANVAVDAARLAPDLESRFGATWTLEGPG